MMTIIPILQLMACTTLAVVAIQWRLTHSASENAFRHLLPFIAAAGVLGIILLFPYAIEFFVANYSGALYEVESISFRFNGPYWWVYWLQTFLPLLPILGLFPFVGKRPILMVVFAGLAMLPVAHATIASTLQ